MATTESRKIIDAATRKRLEKAGFGTIAEFPSLTPAQSELIEIKLALTDALRQQREAGGISQVELAGKIGSSQSRIAKMEAGDPHVSLDLMIRALLAAGMMRGELARIIAGQEAQSPAAGTQPDRPASNRAAGQKAPKKRGQKPQAVSV
jgi:transcriptional regulator with XRE-family HTH domain